MSRACLVVLVLMLWASFARAAENVPAIVQAAGAQDSVAGAGSIVSHRHLEIVASAGPEHYTQSNDANILAVDGAFRDVHYTKIIENGKTASDAEMTQQDQQTDAQLAHGEGFFHQPYDRRYFAEYTYHVLSGCSVCTRAQTSVAFDSALHDASHGNGTMRIDNASGRVLELQYTPFVFPDHASAGTTVETFGEPIAGLWTIVRIDRTYSGRVLFISGRGTVTETIDRFRRFADLGAATAYYREQGN